MTSTPARLSCSEVSQVEGHSHGFGLASPSWRANLDVVVTVLIVRLKVISRYKGSLVMEMFLPVVFAAMPILLGVAVGGANAGQYFQANTGTSNFKLYMLIGACTFSVVSIMLWLVGYWIRREQETGTLESIYLAPARQVYVLTGVTIYSLLRALLAFVVSLVIGSLVFGVNLLEGNVLGAIGILMLGMLPLWGLSMLFGAFIMRVKEANSVINVMTWVVSFLMGVFFPITMFPPLLRWAAAIFPPTVMNDAMRASMLNLSTFFGSWYISLAVMFAAALTVPLVGYGVFTFTGRSVRRKEGVGQY